MQQVPSVVLRESDSPPVSLSMVPSRVGPGVDSYPLSLRPALFPSAAHQMSIPHVDLELTDYSADRFVGSGVSWGTNWIYSLFKKPKKKKKKE